MPVGKVRDAHRRIRHVDVLAAGARGAEGVDAQIVELDVDLDLVVHLRVDEHRGERGVPPRVGVERRDAHQPVHADFRLQQAVGVLAVDLEGDRLDARAFALQPVGDHGLEALALGPAQVHAQQHLGPVLAFGAAGAGVDGDDGAARVVFAGEQHGGLEALQQLAVGLHVALDIGRRRPRLRGPVRRACRGRRSCARMRSSLAMASSRRLRSCMTFWLFSGWFQKSGAEICSSVSASFCLLRGGVKDTSARPGPGRGGAGIARSSSSTVMGVQSNSNK